MTEISVARSDSLPRSPGRRVLRREEAEAWLDGYRFVDEARRAADALLRNAEAAHQEAKARGFEEGRRAGDTRAVAIVADTVANVDRYLASIHGQIAELAMSIVERVLGRIPAPDLVAATAQQALESLRREKYVRIRVSPDVIDDVQRAISAWSQAKGLAPTLIVEADAQLAPTQCIVLTEFAVLDASLDAQLGIIREALAANAVGASRS